MTKCLSSHYLRYLLSVNRKVSSQTGADEDNRLKYINTFFFKRKREKRDSIMHFSM